MEANPLHQTDYSLPPGDGCKFENGHGCNASRDLTHCGANHCNLNWEVPPRKMDQSSVIQVHLSINRAELLLGINYLRKCEEY